MKTEVLISGAGPTGLMMACQLRRFGVEVLLIEKRKGVTPLSKALAVQARTMEVYDQLGIGAAAIAQGKPGAGVKMVARGNEVGRLTLGEFGGDISPFPFILILEQSKNEKLLIEKYLALGGEILWNTTLVDFEDNGDGVVAQMLDGNGNELSCFCDFLVGADGASSMVRKKEKIPFQGGTYEDLFLVADLKVDWEFGKDYIVLMFEKGTFGGFFPFSEEGRFRMVSIVPDEFEDREDLSFEDLEPYLKSNFSAPVEFSDVNWFATYKVHHRYVPRFQSGRIFLAGDAAHVHSPAGGQGMNTGLQDANNLAWKIAYHLRNDLPLSLLDTYTEERQPNAIELINTTDTAFTFIAGNRWYHSFFRQFVLPVFVGLASRFDKVKKIMFARVSQTKINYRGRSLSQGKVGQLIAGDRFPFLYFSTQEGTFSSFDLQKNTSFNLICPAIYAEAIQKKIDQLAVAHWVKVHGLLENNTNDRALKKMKLPTTFLCLIRPDHHIALISKRADPNMLEAYLNNCLWKA